MQLPWKKKQNIIIVEVTKVPIDRQMDKQNVYIYTIEYYSALKWEEILSHIITWMNVKNIILREIS